MTTFSNTSLLRRWVPVLLFAFCVVWLYTILLGLPYFGDWDSVYYPVLFLDNPYDHKGFLNPPWVLFILYPLSLFSKHVAGALWMTISVVIVIYCARKLGSDWLGYFLIFTNPSFIRFLSSGQIDALILLGLVLTQFPWNILLLVIKPQVFGMAIFLKLRTVKVIHLLIISTIVILTLAIFGNWFQHIFHNWQIGVNHNVSMDVFPYGIPIGIVFFLLARKNSDLIIGALSSFFFVPYVSPSSIFIYAILIFSSFTTINRLIVYGLLWTMATMLM